MSSQSEIRQRVTTQIIEALQRGVAPWRKPWLAAENAGFPSNVASKKRYSGINPLLLQLAARERGFRSQWWATYQQWQNLGGQVVKRPNHVPPGQWGTKIVFFKPVTTMKRTKEGEKEVTFPLLREYTVFNADQVEGADQYRVRPPNDTGSIDFEPAERMIQATGADIRHVYGNEAIYYRPPADCIKMPLKHQFETGPGGLEGYYDTLCHEVIHWSEVRLGWTGSYDLGELRAEMGAAYLTAAIGVRTLSDVNPNANHAKYLASWIKAMNEDHRVIFRIASAASKAADFILGFSRKPEVEEVVTA
jgi:antirestriction protein ArdC